MKCTKTDSVIYLSSGVLTCTLDAGNGSLLSVKTPENELCFDGIMIDAGCNGDYVLKTLAFDNMLDKNTWELPGISPERNPAFPEFIGFEEGNNTFSVCYKINSLNVKLVYSFTAGVLKVHAEISNLSPKELRLNGLAFITRLKSNAIFDFPSNVPCYEYDSSALNLYEPVCSGLINSCIHSKTSGIHFNLAFIDPIEKWSSGVWRSEKGIDYVYVPNLELMLKPSGTVSCGSLYLQIVDTGNPYLKIPELYEALGYTAAQGGITEGVMYSCHPHGTMDTNFPLNKDLYTYAGYLDELKDMGIDHVWLLPIFDHGDRGVYHSTDQSVIDTRYGGDEAVKYYCDKAHSLGMTVLFDYVPHGPAPSDPIALLHQDWCSKRPDGSNHIEWDCVSFDYNNPGYQNYTTEMVYDHVKRFSVDGARIDCAMGGLSNWHPFGDNRPSGNSVKAGVNITKAVRDGFLKGGKKSFILPENFNPIPCYYPYTDIFYGMNLYRVFCELDSLIHDEPARYVKLLTFWLEREYWSTPSGYTKLRFLGNHDTVSWVWQSARAVDYYGLETAKALWAVISLIDGMPMIYQGDEDPKWYLKEDGVVLKDFFKKLFADRRQYIGSTSKIQYVYTGTPVMSFIRFADGKMRLVLVNLSNENSAVSFDTLNIKDASILTGNGLVDVSRIVMAPYSYGIFEI